MTVVAEPQVTRTGRVPILPDRDPLSTSRLSLLVDLASLLAREVDFVASNDDAALVSSICVRLDGIPLALELAAARLSSMSLSQETSPGWRC